MEKNVIFFSNTLHYGYLVLLIHKVHSSGNTNACSSSPSFFSLLEILVCSSVFHLCILDAAYNHVSLQCLLVTNLFFPQLMKCITLQCFTSHTERTTSATFKNPISPLQALLSCNLLQVFETQYRSDEVRKATLKPSSMGCVYTYF